MSGNEWGSGPVVAWTDRDGPGRPPGAPGWAWVASASLIAVALTVVIATDSLCPEHRMWVQALGLVAIGASGAAVVGVLRSWSAVPWLVLTGSVFGAAIGAIDAAHAPVRGTIVTFCFIGAFAIGIWLARQDAAARRWVRELGAELHSVSPDLSVNDPSDAASPRANAEGGVTAPTDAVHSADQR